MPYKCQKTGVYTISGIVGKDKRVKLSEKQKLWIKLNPPKWSNYRLARAFGVSKRTIQFIRNPQSRLDNLERRKERGGTKAYYDKEKHREATKTHRQHKQALFLSEPNQVEEIRE